MFNFLFILLIFLCSNSVYSGYIEKITISGCESCKLHLTCRHLTSIIAIFEANFQKQNDFFNSTKNNNYSLTTLFKWITPFPQIYLRKALNKRCSGINHCSFILTEDYPEADKWGSGTVYVKYACISEDRIKTFCNSEIVLPNNNNIRILDGFIHNPGYPRFYASEKNCKWKISTSNEQQIKITIFDISITGDIPLFPDGCSDYLQIYDSAQLIHSTCNLQEPPFEIISQSNTLEIILKTTHTLTPQRGILIYYTAIGCLTPKPPEDGYLVYRNQTAAEFRCCVGFVFPDDGKRQRIIYCLGTIWDIEQPLPNCQRKALLPVGNLNYRPKNADMASDIIAPALLIVALFAINCGIVYYIYKKKKQQTIIYEDEELGTLRQTNPNKDQTMP